MIIWVSYTKITGTKTDLDQLYFGNYKIKNWPQVTFLVYHDAGPMDTEQIR